MTDWKPTASFETLKARGELFARIREFFSRRKVLEVDTPLLSTHTVTDPFIQSFSTKFSSPQPDASKILHFQTSPEYAMKRLLAAGSGPIYQLGKVYRNEEQGRYHGPEFTMLEWYQIDFDHHKLMAEVDEFLQVVANCKPAEKISYYELYQQHLNIDPHLDSVGKLRKTALANNLDDLFTTDERDRSAWLDLMISHLIEYKLGLEKPVFIYDYPKCQAALAKLSNSKPQVAERFEVYYKGIELGNGFHELLDSKEQEFRFKLDQEKRKKLGLNIPEIDSRLISALEHGMPACAGISIGIDRLLMTKLNKKSFKEVVSFTV